MCTRWALLCRPRLQQQYIAVCISRWGAFGLESRPRSCPVGMTDDHFMQIKIHGTVWGIYRRSSAARAFISAGRLILIMLPITLSSSILLLLLQQNTVHWGRPRARKNNRRSSNDDDKMIGPNGYSISIWLGLRVGIGICVWSTRTYLEGFFGIEGEPPAPGEDVVR